MLVPSDRWFRRRVFLVALACVAPLVGCSGSTEQPVAPIRYSPPPPAPPYVTPTTPTTPSPNAKAVIYQGQAGLYDSYNNYLGGTSDSQYVLYDDGTFALEFTTARFGPFSYFGRYTRTDSHFVFSWDGSSAAGPWGSQATLHGDTLKVTYNLVMSMSDFVDGPYVRSAATP